MVYLTMMSIQIKFFKFLDYSGITNWMRFWKKTSGFNLRFHSGIFEQELRINRTFYGQSYRSPSQDSNMRLAQHTASVRPVKHPINSETQ